MLARCGADLGAILSGRLDPLERLFAGGTAGGRGLVSRHARLAVARRWCATWRPWWLELPSGRSLRIVEIGAGTGGTTQGILDVLPGGPLRNLASDLSAALVRRLKDLLGLATRACGYRLLDIQRSAWHKV